MALFKSKESTRHRRLRRHLERRSRRPRARTRRNACGSASCWSTRSSCPPSTWRPHCSRPTATRCSSPTSCSAASASAARSWPRRSPRCGTSPRPTPVPSSSTPRSPLLVPEQVARQNLVIPIADEDGTIVMLSADPSPERRAAVEQLRPAAGPLAVGRPRHDPHVHRPQLPRRRRHRSAGAGVRPRPTTSRSRRTKAGEVNLDDQAPDRPAGQPHRQPGDARPHQRHPRRAARRQAAHPVPHRRSPGRGVQPADRRALGAHQPPEDHERHEHRREAPPAGRPVLDDHRRQGRRRPRRLAWPPCSARRSSCESSTRAGR